jgi:PAS domain S-box-containing protein
MPAMLDSVREFRKGISMIWQTPPPVETHWEVSCTPIIGPDGDLDAILGTWHRITEQVMLRRKIESREQRLRSFIDSATDWISMKDLDGRYIMVNPVCAAAFGRKPDDFINKKVEDLLPPDLARMTRRHDEEVIHTRQHHTYNEIVLIDGKDHHFQAVRFPLSNYQGESIGVCTIMRDVTKEHELNNQLAQATKLAAVGQLAAGVAHEINNPLTGILAYAEDLRDELPENDPLRDDVKVIIRETLRCRDIVRNLLDFARQETPKLRNVNPNKIVDQSLALVEKLPQFRNINIWKKQEKNIPSVRCDARQMQQVVLNLMLNAAEAMKEKGMIIISTAHDKRHDKCLIAVQDSGPGIPENMIDKIFEPFFSTKETNGLGLAVSWGIVERHGGVIEIDIPEGGGAVFQIVLPAATGQAAE